MFVAEAMLKYVINYVLENAPEEMNFFNSFVDKGLLDRLHNVVNSDFARVTYTEAIEILEKNNDKFDYKMSGSKAPDFDAYGLLRATHSHNPTQYSHIVGLSSHFYAHIGAGLRSFTHL